MNRAAAIAASTVLAGSAALQAPVNARLGQSIGTLPASLVSFGVSVLLLAVAAVGVVGPANISNLPKQLSSIGMRNLTGGFIGASYVVISLLTVDALGAGGLIAASVAGTLVGAVGIDWAGVLGVRKVPPRPLRLVGVALLLAGVVLVTGGGRFDPLATAAIFVAGLLVAFQPPVNARLAAHLGGLRAALTQSSIGLAALLVVTAFSLPFAAGGSGADLPWWAFIGGLFGAFYVVSTLASVPAIGAGAVAAASIAGGLAFGAVADLLGLFGLERVDFTASRSIGFALIAGGAGLVLRRQS